MLKLYIKYLAEKEIRRELEDRIHKAIKYIYKNSFYINNHYIGVRSGFIADDLIKILEGYKVGDDDNE